MAVKVKHMVDIETYSNLPIAAIASIGGVKFDLDTGEIYDEFYVTIDPASCKAAGLHFSKKTMAWWKTQAPEVRQALYKDNIPLAEAMQKFLDWYEPKGEFYCWGMFDMGIITYAIHQSLRQEPKWDYWDSWECRTMAKLIDQKIDRAAAGSQHHNALDDAKTQAKFLITFSK